MNLLSERKSFKRWKVDLVYEAQDGACVVCGGTLKKGFHRHHKDGDPSNNDISNLELRCADCHRATFKEAYKAHKDQERQVLASLNKLLEQGFEGKLSGANMERMLEAMTMSLKLSRSINKLDQGIEYPSAAIAMRFKMDEIKKLTEQYLAGLREGISLGIRSSLEKDNR